MLPVLHGHGVLELPRDRAPLPVIWCNYGPTPPEWNREPMRIRLSRAPMRQTIRHILSGQFNGNNHRGISPVHSLSRAILETRT